MPAHDYSDANGVKDAGVAARVCAVELLEEVLTRKRPFDQAVQRHANLQALSPRDRNFARLLVLTALRRLGQIDALLAPMLVTPLTGRAMRVMHCLRIGVVQLLWLNTPTHAALYATVETAATIGYASMKGLVNAVLKRVNEQGAAIIATQDEAMLNVPEWLFSRWVASYGDTQARAIAQARLSEAPLDISVASDPAGWAERLGGVLMPQGSVRLTQAGKVDELEGYHEGQWWVQDLAATLPVQLLGDVRGLRVLDLCAAPGGKTAQLASQGAHITALDTSARRLATLQRNLQRLSLSVQVVEADLLRWKSEEQFDAVLLDAPCSATGTLRRHPEVVYHRTLQDIDELARLQGKMLTRAAHLVKPGGRLVYCVCSLQSEEGEAQIDTFLAKNDLFSPLPDAVGRIAQASEWKVKHGALRTLPAYLSDAGGMDGFYAICLQRLNNL